MASELSLSEPERIARLLTKRTSRGVIIFGTLRIAVAIAAGIGFVSGEYFAAIGAIFTAILFGLSFDHVKKRRDVALLVAKSPEMVYWAHPTRITQAMAKHPAGNITPLTVHLRNGHQFEATLSPPEQRIFVEWLSQANPTIRWGPYDDVPVSA